LKQQKEGKSKPINRTREPLAVASFIVAAVAVVLSQFPPIYTFFQSPEYVTEIGEYLQLDHQVGFIGLGLSFHVANSGSVPGRVKEMQLSIRSTDGRYEKRLSALTFATSDQYAAGGARSNVQTSFTSISVGQGEDWGGFIIFAEPIDNQIQVSIRELQYKVVDYIENDTSGSDLVEIPSELEQQASMLARSNLKRFPAGEYIGRLSVVVDGDANIEKCFRFALGADVVAQFERRISEYRYGIGIHPNSSSVTPPSFVKIMELECGS
jgi:hypothetical protein